MKIMSFILAVGTAVLLTITCMAAGVSSFSDVPSSHWAYDEVMSMAQRGIINGTGAVNAQGVGVFSPNGTMQRSAFITMMMRYLFPADLAAMPTGATWYSNAYDLALQKGILDPGDFAEDKLTSNITRQEMAYILDRAAQHLGLAPAQLVDSTDIPDWNQISPAYRDSVQAAYSLGLLTGVNSKGTFSPNGVLNRASGATVMYRLIGLKEGTYVPEFPASSGQSGVQGILSQVPYYGDVSKSKLTEEQADAYAALLTKGLAGQIPFGDFWSGNPIPWDQRFEESNAFSTYETSRSKAILADLSGNGVPYLFLYDSEIPMDSSCTVYGWNNGKVEMVTNLNSYLSRQSPYLQTLSATGEVVLSFCPANGFDNVNIWEDSFVGTEMETTYQYSCVLDWDTNIYHVNDNGVKSTYAGDFDDRPEIPNRYDGAKQYAWDTLADVCKKGVFLKEMVAILNSGADTEQPGSVTPEESPAISAEAASAMLQKIDELDPVFARLLDADLDGQDELLLIYYPPYNLPCAAIFDWRNGALVQCAQPEMITNDISLVKRTTDGHYGFCSHEQMQGESYGYTFTDDSFLMSAVYTGEYTKDYISISKAEYDQTLRQYTVVEKLATYSGVAVSNGLAEVQQQLQAIQ